jgi:hypothetical protein
VRKTGVSTVDIDVNAARKAPPSAALRGAGKNRVTSRHFAGADRATGGRAAEQRVLTSGTKQEMLALERKVHETLPIGPEERQSFYIDKQVAKGLRPPPY